MFPSAHRLVRPLTGHSIKRSLRLASPIRAGLLVLAAVLLSHSAARSAETSGPLVQPEDLLSRLPADQLPAHGAPPAGPALEAANTALDRLTSGPPIPGHFQLSIAAIFLNPTDSSVYCDAPNSLGYPISVYAHFTDDWKQQLSKLKPGDSIDFTGTVADARFRAEADKSSLSITLDHAALAGADLQTPLLKALAQGTSWAAAALPGTWKVVSLDPIIQSQKVCRPIFGTVPNRVLVFCQDGRISQVEIVYLETGYSMSLWKQNSDADIQRYQSDLGQLAGALPDTLAAFTGHAGKPIRLTSGSPVCTFDMQEYTYQGLSMRLYVDAKNSVCLFLSRSGETSTALWQASSLAERTAALARNVERDPNGDTIIRHFAIIDQDGRPYCGPAVWTELCRYYGLNIFQKMMLNDGRDGGEGVGPAAHVSIVLDHKFDFPRIQRSIDSGNLIWFSAPGHVALISGYNAKTNEIFRSDSWGEGARNQRVPLDKFSKEANGFLYFAPLPD